MNVRSKCALVAVLITLGAGLAPVQAQSLVRPAYKQAISANPFGLLLGIFNAEYERVVTESASAGFGGSMLSSDDDDYVNADVFFRLFPGGQPLKGWAFGGKVGVTKIANSGTYFGVGFDMNYTRLMGRNENLYVGLGFGLKRLYGTEPGDLLIIPTFRIVNVGFAF